MTEAVGIALWIVVVLAALPALWISLQIWCGLAPLRTPPPRQGPLPRLALLVPAHDEENRLAETLAALTADPLQRARILVIADNCTDATADVARRYDVEVVERCAPAVVGKGHALALGIASLDPAGCEVVGVIDADTDVDGRAIEILARRAHEVDGPVQGCFLHSRPSAGDAWSAFNCFAVLVNNLIRQRGRTRMGLPCHMNGSGMFLPLAVAQRVDWSGGRLAEDAELGLDLVLGGQEPIFEPRATLSSATPVGREATLAQRSGWMSGRLGLTARRTLGALLSACRQRRPRIAAAALDLALPPASLIAAMLMGALVAIVGASALEIAIRGPLLIWCLAAASFCQAGALAWWLHGRALVSAGIVVRIPGMLARQALALASRLLSGRLHWEG